MLQRADHGADAPLLGALLQDVHHLSMLKPDIKARPKPGATEAESIAMWRRNKAAATMRLRRKEEKLKANMAKLKRRVKNQPKYDSALFKCMADWDKCNLSKETTHSTICFLLFLLCVGQNSKATLSTIAAGIGGAVLLL